MLRRFLADLHVHTVLSPCAEYRMIPSLIIQRAKEMGLNLLAVTDHNSGENAAAMVAASEGSGVAVIPGMEVETREGVHVVALFDRVDDLANWQDRVYGLLPARENDERAFGVQLVVDPEGELVGINRRLLITAIDSSIEDVVEEVRSMGGICIPAHVDRPANGLLGVLGLIPEGLPVPAFEISPRLGPQSAVDDFPVLTGRAIIQSSDAHSLDDLGRAPTIFWIERPVVDEIALACRGSAGRRIAFPVPIQEPNPAGPRPAHELEGDRK